MKYAWLMTLVAGAFAGIITYSLLSLFFVGFVTFLNVQFGLVQCGPTTNCTVAYGGSSVLLGFLVGVLTALTIWWRLP